MGLDMYLTGELYLPLGSDETKIKLIPKISKLFGITPKLENERWFDQNIPYAETIKFSLFYWRKKNWIHKWFVDNLQDGKDECQRTYVSKENLQNLIDELKAVLDNKYTKEKHINMDYALDVLPPQEGFFFGWTNTEDQEFLEYYFDSIKHTHKHLSKLLTMLNKNKKLERINIYYQSSW